MFHHATSKLIQVNGLNDITKMAALFSGQKGTFQQGKTVHIQQILTLTPYKAREHI